MAQALERIDDLAHLAGQLGLNWPEKMSHPLTSYEMRMGN
jgi:hypothetical protein